MADLILNLLGGFELRLSGEPPLSLSTKTGQALLAYLALTPGQRHSRDKITAMLWEDRPDQQARTSLRQTLAILRKAIPSAQTPWLCTDGDWITLNHEAFALDVTNFLRLAATDTMPALAEAAALYRGELLQGFNLRSEGFTDWLRDERGQLHQCASRVLGKLLALQEAGDDIDAGIATATRLLALDPFGEKTHRALMRLYARQSRTDAALRQFETCRDRLRRELDVTPEPETEALYREVLARRGRPAARPAPEFASSAAIQASAPRPGKPNSNQPSIAVLPFANSSGDPAQAYLSDGITDDIITELSRYHSLLVIARSSSFQFGGPAVDLDAVRRALGVRYVVEGSVRRAGNRIRVTAQLIDAVTQTHLWAERYDRNVQDIFAVQDEVTRTVVATVEGRVAASGAEYARRKPTKEWAAYDFFLQGRECVNRYQPADAEPLLTRAIELDPGYLHAHAWRAFALCDIYLHDEREETLDAALVSAQRALALDEHDAWAHQAMGFVALRKIQLDLAGQHFDRALNLNPNDVNIAGDHANWLHYVGRNDEALRSLDLAQQRDPFPSNWISEVRGQVFFCLKRFDEAIAAFRTVRPQYFWISGLLAAAYAHKGQLNDAHRELAIFRKLKPGVTLAVVARKPMPEEMRNLWLAGLRKAGLPE